jgi:cytochrome c2
MRYRLLLIAASLLLAACGTVAKPRPTFEPTHTALPRAANISDEPETESDVASDETEVAEEATPVPPTLEPTLEPTAVPTEVPTEEATEEHTDHAEAATEEATEEHTDHTEAATEEATEEHTDDHMEAEAAAEVVVNGFVGDAEVGEFWFTGGIKVTYNNTEWQCSTCHNVVEPIPGNGPFLYGIANHAAEHGSSAGLDAVGYLADSIVNSNHIIAPNQIAPDGTEYVWEADKMPTNWKTVLDDQMIADLVAFLMTQTQEVDSAQHGGHD